MWKIIKCSNHHQHENPLHNAGYYFIAIYSFSGNDGSNKRKKKRIITTHGKENRERLFLR